MKVENVIINISISLHTSAYENIATCLHKCFYNVQVNQMNRLIPVNVRYLPWKVSDWEYFQNSPALLPTFSAPFDPICAKLNLLFPVGF